MSEAAKKETPKESPVLMPHRCHLAEHQRSIRRVYPEAGHSKAQVMEPSYWSMLSRNFRPGDKIEVFAEDGTYYGELLVLACDRTWARVHELSWHTLTNADVSLSQAAKFEYQWKGPVKKHCIVRKSDGEVVHAEAATKDAAVQWLNENLATIS